MADGSAEAATLAEDELRSRLPGALPIACVASEVELLENSTGRWQRLHVFRLGPAAA